MTTGWDEKLGGAGGAATGGDLNIPGSGGFNSKVNGGQFGGGASQLDGSTGNPNVAGDGVVIVEEIYY